MEEAAFVGPGGGGGREGEDYYGVEETATEVDAALEGDGTGDGGKGGVGFSGEEEGAAGGVFSVVDGFAGGGFV